MGCLGVACRGIAVSSSSLGHVCLSMGEMRHSLRPYKASLSGKEPISTLAQWNKLGGPWKGLSAISGELLKVLGPMREPQKDRGCGGTGRDEAARPRLTTRFQLVSFHPLTSSPPPTHGLTCMLLMHPETPAPLDLSQQPTFSEDLRRHPPHAPVMNTSSHCPKVLEPMVISTQTHPLSSLVVADHALSGFLKPGRASARVLRVSPTASLT